MASVLRERQPDPDCPPQEQKDAEISRRRAVYTELIRQVEAYLLRTAERFCPGQHDYAQDLVQETLVRGYEAFLEGRFEEGTNARAWLVKILTNCYLTDLRNRRRHRAETPLDELMQEGYCHPALQTQTREHPDAILLTATLDEPLENALASLSEDLRICVILADIEELSYLEIAQTLHIPLGTVRSRLFRARQQLHDLLTDYAQKRRRD
jgi:RNA polymerase sigma-70 factor, ECF subfamily